MGARKPGAVVCRAGDHEGLGRPGVRLYGFAYGVGEHGDRRWRDRYGEGTLAGKRAMLIVTAGGWEEHYTPRGVNNDSLSCISETSCGSPIESRRKSIQARTRGETWREYACIA